LVIVGVHIAGLEKRRRRISRADCVARTYGADFAGCNDRSVWAKGFLNAVARAGS
jgi:hypothetical protein